MSKSKKILTSFFVLIIVTVFGFFSQIVTFLADYNWFKEVGYTSTFIRQMFSKLYIGVPLFFILSFIIYLYLISIKKSYYSHMNIIVNKSEEKLINIITIIGAMFISLFFSMRISSSLWMEILQFKNSTSFNIKDPIFNKDISYYVFKLPLINQILNILIGFLIFLFIVTIIYYLMLASFKKFHKFGEFDNVRNISDFSSFGDTIRNVVNLALNQIAIIGVVFFVIIAIKSYLATFNLLYSPRGVAYGASYTDIKVNLLVYRLQAVIGIVSAVFIIIAYIRKKLKIALIGPVLLIIISIGASVVENAVQNFIVSPNEIAKEKKFLEYNINYTKKAYNLDKVKEENFLAEQNITIEDILKNEQTLKNISINDYRPTKETYNQLQSIRTYYTFDDIDIDRYIINGKLTQVFLSPREINKEKLESQAKTWLNQHIKYTHGYGITMSPVNEVTPGGEPNMIIKNIPPVSNVDSLKITRPEIYFGELTNDYIITNTSEKEFDYPKGETNAFTEYKGKAGIKLNPFNRLLYAIDQKSFKLLVAGSLNSNSKIILNRNINDRVKKIAPFLSFDQDPYIVLVNGKLYWIIDGYTYTSKYPYSQPYSDNGINYIRNSFKVVIDAYNGDTDFYLIDKNDPIIKTYSKIFPDLFKSIDKMPKDIKEHIRYPQTLFDIQAKVYETYHMKDTGVFYNKEDKWEVAKEARKEGKESEDMESNYITFKLPKEKEAEFLLTIPYTPRGKQNMTALFVARNDKNKYGELIVYKFPKEKNILGPEQVEAKIDKDPEISKDLTQWNTGGSKVIRGNLLTIPIENSILYVEPLYIKSDSKNSIPAVEKIFVAYKDRVVMRDTLEDALNAMFKGNQEITLPDATDKDIINLNKDELIKKANDIYEKAQQSIKNGDFSKYGQYINELGEILKKLKEPVK
ncbi:UPF0182 family membrane protein [Tepidibacter thalassicus]|uniref:UPF0182 protein SAMN02744040_01520 n=1 Tax=Tepidibacter thalassicus DSM 15285 TaxID=1123350 RepID=A0A1M5RV33_9FIRM|nr:UPF0182 family protein [Tepidibacter thalassicus]SHH30104.1 hypothetical protein SAMN02744040_01520 [Tepidibacter thalassicus DSM 15285]